MKKRDQYAVLAVLLSMMLFAGQMSAQNGGNGGSNGGSGSGGGTATCGCQPGAVDCFSGVNMASVNSTNGTQGTFNAPPIPATSSDEVVLNGCAVATATGAPVEVRWRVRTDNNTVKQFASEGPSVGPAAVFGPAGTMTFNATVVNYDQDNPPVNFFVSLVPCTIGLGGSSVTYNSDSQSGQIAVSASPAACQWPVVSAATWLHFASSLGTGSGVLSYTVDANTTGASRVATATIGGQAFTVTQTSTACGNALINPASVTVSSAGATGSIAVTIGSNCSWGAVSNAPWLTVSGGGTGNGSVTYTAAANSDTSNRTGTATIAGQSFTVIQQGAGCTFIVNPTSISLTSNASTGNITLTSATTCPWSASSNVPWVTLNPTSGTGPYPILYSVAANTDPVQRTATLSIAGVPVTISQGPGICAMISPTGAGIAAQQSGTVYSVSVTAATSCSWTAVSTVPWVTVQTGSSGAGFGTVTYTVDDNLTGMERFGSITIGGNTFTVDQAAN